MSGLMAGFYTLSMRVVRLAYLNALWLFFMTLGVVVFGFMPATVAMFYVMRKWLNGHTDFRVFPMFWKVFKKEFLHSNILGGFLLLIGLLLYTNFRLVQDQHLVMMILRYVFLIISVFYIATLIFIFQTYAHFEIKKPLFYMRNALLIALAYPHYSIMMLAGIYFWQEFLMYAPGFIPFFAASFICFMLMWFANKAFQAIDKKETATETQIDLL